MPLGWLWADCHKFCQDLSATGLLLVSTAMDKPTWLPILICHAGLTYLPDAKNSPIHPCSGNSIISSVWLWYHYLASLFMLNLWTAQDLSLFRLDMCQRTTFAKCEKWYLMYQTFFPCICGQAKKENIPNRISERKSLGFIVLSILSLLWGQINWVVLNLSARRKGEMDGD